ncbi:MAG: response regulator transcription factor [Anaeroplasma sp.]
MSNQINVMIVEDQVMPRQLFESIINSCQRCKLILSIEDAKIADICCIKNKIDLIIMDVVTKDGASGLVAAEKIKRNNSNIKIIIVTSMPECSYIDRAKKIGIEGFWYKDFSKEPIIEMIERVIDGEIVYPTEKPIINIGLTNSNEFTKRELEVLREMTGGFTNSEIASKLGISENRVRNHIVNMLEKTGFRSRTELAVRARETGIVIRDRQDDDF